MILLYSELRELRRNNIDKQIVLGSGVFDLIHKGHVDYIKELRDYGDIVVVMVKSDTRVRENKDPNRPIIPESERVEMVDALKYVDYAFVSPDIEEASDAVEDVVYEAVFRDLEPNVFVTANPDWVKLHGVSDTKVVQVNRYSAGQYKSTSDIIKKIKES